MDILNFIKYVSANRLDLEQIIESGNSVNCTYYYYKLIFTKRIVFSFFGIEKELYRIVYNVDCLYCESILLNGATKKSHFCKTEKARTNFELLCKEDLEYMIYYQEALKGMKSKRIKK